MYTISIVLLYIIYGIVDNYDSNFHIIVPIHLTQKPKPNQGPSSIASLQPLAPQQEIEEH